MAGNGQRKPLKGRSAFLACALALVTCGPAAGAAAANAPGDDPLFAVSQQRIGILDLAYNWEPGTTVQFHEVVDGVATPVGTAVTGENRIGVALRAATWRCDRLVRAFTATGTTPDGRTSTSSFDLRTPSCKTRAVVTAPRRVERGSLVRIRIADRWRLGDRPVQLCVSGAGVRRSCREVKLPASQRGVVRRVRARRDGQLRVAIGLAGNRTVQWVASGTAKVRKITTGPVVLATGDSTIQGIDSILADKLGTSVRSEAESFPGTGLTTTGSSNWLQFAPRQVKRFKPTVTVMSIGGNDGHGFGDVACCDGPWVDEYTRRVRTLMRTYRRSGKGRVLWLTLPMPKDPRRQRVTVAVNGAIVAAARGLDRVRVLDLGAFFTPGGTYSDTITRGGRTIRTRAPDGIHLSAAGSELAAAIVADVLTQAGWLE